MDRTATQADFCEAFYRRYSPRCVQQIAQALDQSAVQARELCEREFPTGNYGVAQGVNRWQYIDENLRRTAPFDGGVIVESREFGEAKLLDGDEKMASFTLLRSGEVGLVLCKVKRYAPIPTLSLVRNYMTALGFASTPLFPVPYYLTARYGGSIPKHDLKALFVARYWIDEDDETGATIEKADVVVMEHNGKSIFCEVCDLHAYGATAITGESYIVGEELPMAFRTPEREPETDDLPINLRDNEKES